MQCRYRTILSIDGGGIRGILPLLILQHIQSEFSKIDTQQNLTDWIDIFAGTSTGAIISGALMLSDHNGKDKYTTSDILKLYKTRGKQIFNKQLSTHTNHPEYPLKLVLEQNFQHSQIKDAKKHFLFVSYDLNAQAPFIFTDDMKRYQNLSLSKIMMACSAVPGYFTPITLGEKSLADGMLTAKNPSRLAFEYAKLYYPEDPIVVISMGTGKLDASQNDAIELESIRVHDELQALEKQDKNLIYFRFQPELNYAKSDLADTSNENIRDLESDAHHFIQNNTYLFDRLFKYMSIRAENHL